MSKRTKKGLLIAAGSILGIWIFLFAISFFIIAKGGPYSYALYDKNGNLLGAQVAKDEQWRFERTKVPQKFETAIIQFEDKRFYFHPGVDIISINRAIFSNFKSKRIVSGGSTITMQTVRILENNPKRTYSQKIKEAFLALVLEVRYTKKQILQIYAANAPFGGNVVGLEAASWRYFNRPPSSLSWAEAATLAVLPNQPSLVYPGANSQILLEKRNTLLKRLFEKKYISEQEYNLSLLEPLPEKPYDLPRFAPHYLEYLKNTQKGKTKFYTTLDSSIQKNTTRIVEYWSDSFARKGINNACAIILDTKTKEVLAYCGNTAVFTRNIQTGYVDLIQSKRSSGSLLKPFLYGAMLDSGQLLPQQLVIDIPTRIGNYRPDNNIPKYAGVVQADQALSRSLNIPAIRELREYGLNAFLDILHQSGFTTFNRSSDEYGLPLILGGGEITLFEATKAYANMMNRACMRDCDNFPLSTGAAYLTLLALAEGTRPEEESNWQIYANSKKIAWKTGTSNGNRDTWAIGTTDEYTVGVWVGNSTGEGNPELKSFSTSAPLLFDIFSSLPVTSWPVQPFWELKVQEVCYYSGYAAGPYCDRKKECFAPKNASIKKVCPYCNSYSFTPDGKYQATVTDLKDEFPIVKNRFVLPPNLELWYKKINISYIPLPDFVPWHTGFSENEISILFPEPNAILIVPIEIDGSQGSMVMQAATHSNANILYWDLDGDFIGTTDQIHEMKVSPNAGKHILTITDSLGNTAVRSFEVASTAD